MWKRIPYSDVMGLSNGRVFGTPGWVDERLPPGHTSLHTIYTHTSFFEQLQYLQYFFLSPNLFWFLITLLIYFLFPYDLTEAKIWSWEYFVKRLVVNCFIIISYTGFWYVTLYKLKWGKRRYQSDYEPAASTVLHNVYYTILGCFQWTVWEVAFLYGFANKRLPVVMDQQLFSSWYNVAGLIFWILFIPIWREAQFYFVHRFIHLRPYYKFVHSLHHRNVYPEPFSGLAMHPIEHLMYILPCLAPSLYFGLSPFILLWNGIHLMTSPVGAHAGFEDIFLNDQLHHIHHTTFNSNFGGLGLPLDLIFGTFKPLINEHKQAKDSRILFGPSNFLPGPYHILFNLSTSVIFLFTCWAVIRGNMQGVHLAALFTLAPPLLATSLHYLSKDKMPISWPFQGDPWLSLHTILGLLNFLPIYHTILAIAP